MPFHFLITDIAKLSPGEDAVAELTPLFAQYPGFDRVTSSSDEGEKSKSAFKICFTSKHLAMKAKPKLKKQKFKGVKLQFVSEAEEASLFANARKNRLIVRNLPFKIDDAGLKAAFAAFGQVQEVSIPRRKDDPKKMLGFGFVQFQSGDQAAAALKGMNMSDLLGRKVAVDWAVPKKQFESKAIPTLKPIAERDSAVEMDDDDDDDDDEDDDDDVDDGQNEEGSDNDDSGSEEMKDASMKSDDDDDDDDDDNDDDDDDDEEDEGKKEPSKADDFDREEWNRKKK